MDFSSPARIAKTLESFVLEPVDPPPTSTTNGK